MASSVAAAIIPTLLATRAAAQTKVSAKALKPMVIAMREGSLRTLDPNNAYEPEWFVFGRALYDQLITIKGSKSGQIAPDYASAWDMSADGLTYVFKLNPALRFWDGSPVTPDDLVFSFRRFINLKGPGSWLLEGVESIEKTGAQEVKIKLKEINVDLLAILTTPSLNVAKAAEIKAHGGTDASDAAQKDTARAWLDQHSIGSGPFTLERWTHGSELVLKRNPKYWGTPAPVETVIFKFVNDSNVQRDLLLRGDAHIAINLTPDLAADLKSRGASKVDILEVPALAPAYFGWSAKKNPALANPAVWDAVKYAIDYDGLAAIYRGGGQFTGSIVPPTLAGALPVSERMRTNLDKAKAALRAAGHLNGFQINVTYGSDATYTTVPAPLVAQKVAADLQRVGIHLNLNPVLFSQMLTDYRAGKLEAVFHWWSADYMGWTDFLPTFAPGGVVGKKRQDWDIDAGPQAKEIAEITATAVKTSDTKEQYALVQKAQRLLNEHGPYAFLFETNYQLGVRKDFVKSLQVHPVWYFDLDAIELA